MQIFKDWTNKKKFRILSKGDHIYRFGGLPIPKDQVFMVYSKHHFLIS
jgi:hypothetical protein